MSTYTDMMAKYGKRKRTDDAGDAKQTTSVGSSYFESVMAKYGKRRNEPVEQGNWQYGGSSLNLSDENSPATPALSAQRKPIEGWQRPREDYYQTKPADIGNAPIFDPESYYRDSKDKDAALRTIRSSSAKLASWSPEAQVEEANEYAQMLHEQQEKLYDDQAAAPVDTIDRLMQAAAQAKKPLVTGQNTLAPVAAEDPAKYWNARLSYEHANKPAFDFATRLARQEETDRNNPLRALIPQDFNDTLEYDYTNELEQHLIQTGAATKETAPQMAQSIMAEAREKLHAPKQNRRSWLDHLGTAGANFVNQAGKFAGSTLNLAEQATVGNIVKFAWKLAGASDEEAQSAKEHLPIHMLYEDINRNIGTLNEQAEADIANMSNDTEKTIARELYNLSGQLGSSAMFALTSVMSWAAGGAQAVAEGVAGATTKGLEAFSYLQSHPSLARTLSNALWSMVQRPDWMQSFTLTFGTDFEEAKADGASDLNAVIYAIGNGILNATVEVGGDTGEGGLQSIPEKASRWKALSATWLEKAKDYLKSILQEGKEEVVQGVIQRLMQNISYEKGNPILPNTGDAEKDADAVFNPSTAWEEFKGGAVGAVFLGGVQTKIVQLAKLGQYAKVGSELTNAFPEDMRDSVTEMLVADALSAPEGSAAHEYGVKVAEKIEAGEKIGNAMLGRLYVEVENAAKTFGTDTDTVPTEPASQQQTVSVPVMQAIDQVMDGERVTNRVADSIIQDDEAVAYLQSETGLEITDGMTNSQKREAVRTAVNSLVGTMDITAQENGTQPAQDAPATQENRTPAQHVADIGQTLNLGTNGITALTEQYDGESDPMEYAKAMTVVYNAGSAVASGETYNEAAVQEAFGKLTEAQQMAAWKAGLNDAQETLATEASAEYDNYINNEVTEGTTYGQGDTGYREGRIRGQRYNAAQQGEEVAGGAAATGGVNDQGGVAEATGGGRKGDAWSPRRGKTPEARNLVYGREVTDSELGVKTDPSAPKVRAVTSGETSAMKRANSTMKRVGELIGAKVRSLFFGGSDLSIVEDDGSISRGVEAFSQAWRNFVALPADHPGITVDRFAGHEGMEELLSHGVVKLDEVVDAVRDIIGDDVFDEAVGVYRSIYHSDDTAHWTKEFICDGAGNINRQTAYVDVSDSPLLQARAQLLDVVLETIHNHLNEITNGAFSDVPPLESQTTDETDVPFVSEETQQTLEDVGAQIDAKSESAAPADHTTQYSERTWSLSDYVQKRNEAAKEIAKVLGVSEKTAKKYIDNINSVAKMIADDRTRLDYEAAEGVSSFVSNVEYGGSVDFSTICKKRRLLTGTFEAIQKAIPDTVLTVDDVLQIRDIMKKAGYEVSCGLCYVEGSRAKMGEYGKHFVDLYKKYHPDAKWFPNMYDVTTPTGAEKMRVNHPEAYKEYEYFWNHYGKLREGDPNLFASQQKPKLFQAATEYNGEILKLFKGDETVAEKNRNGGLRLQSFSDFEIIHLIDTMQVIMDMSRVGLAGHAYTKVPDFAWAVGGTGLKVNLSLIAKGVDENGRIILDEVEGMQRAEAEKLRKAYSKNVGTILVTFNDEQLKAALNDPFIDFIIPFHRSQWAAQYYGILGLPAKVQDATLQQSEKLIEQTYHKGKNGQLVADKAKNFMPNEYWDFSKTGKENAENYLRLCAENNKHPKFSKLLVNNGDGSYSLQPDGSTDGYWKLLIDFKMYDNSGKGSPQMPVAPKFNMEQAMRMLDEYKGGHEKFPVAQDVVDKFLSEYSVAPPQGERGVDAALARKLEQARKRAAYWKGQTKTTTKALTKVAQDAITTYNSTVKASDLLTRLQSLARNIFRAGDTAVDYEAIQTEARDIARDIVNGAEILQDESKDFATIREQLDGTRITISREDAAQIDNYLEFRRHLPKYFHISTESKSSKGGVTTNVGTLYDSLRGEFPALFPDIDGAGAQLQQIADVMQNLDTIITNPYSDTMAEAIQWCANGIIDAITGESIVPTVADKQEARYQEMRQRGKNALVEAKKAGAEKLAAERQKGKDALDALRKASQERLDAALKEKQEDSQKRLADLRADRDKKLADLKQHYRDVAAAKRERKTVSEIGTRLLKIMRRLKAMKMSTANAAVRDELIGEFDLVAKSLTDAKAENLQGLRNWYDDQKENNPNFISNPYVEEAIKRLSRKHISDLSVEEMIELTNVLLNFEHNVRTQNEFINSVIGMETYAAGAKTIRDIENSKGSNGNIIEKLETLNLLSPERAMHRFAGYVDSDPLYIATQELSKGGVKQLDYQRRAYDIFKRFLDDTKFMDSISGKKARWESVKVMQVDGSEVTVNLTPAMRISLYLSSLNDNNLRHIRDGGVTIPDKALYLKGKLSDAMANGTRVKLEPSTVRRIASGMTEQERAFARAAWRYFNEFSSPEIAAVSEAKDGFARPMVDNYFPIDTNRNYLKKEFDAIKRDGSMDGVGWLQERVAGANNPIYLYDADFVVKKAIDAHSKYVGYAIPVQNFGKLWGITTGYWTDDGKYESYVNSVQDAMQKKWGKDAIDYVENMMEAISFTGMAPDSIGSVLRKARSAYAGAVLTFSPGTAIMQTTSYPTAAYILGAGPLLKALKVSNKKVDLSLIQKYTPLLWYRSKGYIDPEFGDITRSGKTGSWVTNMIQAMDVATTTKLWTASEFYVQEHNKDLTVGTDDYYKAVADVYNRVIRETQPNYTPMERPQVLKSKNDLTRSLVMFATQRFQNFNILYDSLGKMQAEKTRWKNTGDESAKQAYQEASKAASRAIWSQLSASFAFALVTALRDFLRGKTRKYKDKDDEYTFWSVAGGVGRNMLANGFGMFILGSEAIEIVEGLVNSIAKGFSGENLLDTNFYGFEVSALENLTNIVNDSFKLAESLGDAAGALAKGEVVDVEALIRNAAKAAGDVGSLAGVPIANVRRVLEVVGRLGLKGVGAVSGNKHLFDYYALRITSDPDKSKTEYYDLLYKAYKSGAEDYHALYDLMLKDGFTESGANGSYGGIRAAMEKRMKEERGVESVKDLPNRYEAP